LELRPAFLQLEAVSIEHFPCSTEVSPTKPELKDPTLQPDAELQML